MQKAVAVKLGKSASVKPPTIKGINHLAIPTNDMEATVRFWVGLLGLELKVASRPPVPPGTKPGSDPNRMTRYYFMALGNGDMLSFEEYPSKDTFARDSYTNYTFPEGNGTWPGRRERPDPPSKVDHIALEVETVGEVLTFQKRLREHGIPTSEVTATPYFTSIFLYDPNGIPLQIGAMETKNPAVKPVGLDDPEPIPFLRDKLANEKKGR